MSIGPYPIPELLSGRLLRSQFTPVEVYVLSGATTSNAIDGRGGSGFGLVVPSVVTSTTISFTVSAKGATYQALYSTSNTLVSMTIAASRSYDLPTELFSWPFFKIVTGSAEGADRTFLVSIKG